MAAHNLCIALLQKPLDSTYGLGPPYVLLTSQAQSNKWHVVYVSCRSRHTDEQLRHPLTTAHTLPALPFSHHPPSYHHRNPHAQQRARKLDEKVHFLAMVNLGTYQALFNGLDYLRGTINAIEKLNAVLI